MEVGNKISVKVVDLLFDPKNPRLPENLQGVKDEKKVIEYMVGYANITDLMESIAESGYSDAEPLLVVPNNKGKYIVVEGNRRLAAVKLLNNPELSELRVKNIKEIVDNLNVEVPEEIPCVVYEKRESILDYLGYRHITGVKDWGALEKARYLDQLYDIHIETSDTVNIYKKLAKMIGSKPNYVKNLHMALKLYDYANDEAYYQTGIKEKDINFSWITTILGYTGIGDYIGYDHETISLDNINKDNFRKLFIWMYDKENGVVSESRDLSILSAVLASDEATKKLEGGATLSEAVLYTSEPEDAFLKMLKGAKTQLEQAKSAIEQLNRKPDIADSLLNDIDKLKKTISGALYANFNEDVDTFKNKKISDLSDLSDEQKRRLIELLGNS